MVLGLRLTLALAALCLLLVAGAMRLFLPAQQGIAELVAGVAAALVAVPVFVEAWASLGIRACTASPTAWWRWH